MLTILSEAQKEFQLKINKKKTKSIVIENAKVDKK